MLLMNVVVPALNANNAAAVDDEEEEEEEEEMELFIEESPPPAELERMESLIDMVEEQPSFSRMDFMSQDEPPPLKAMLGDENNREFAQHCKIDPEDVFNIPFFENDNNNPLSNLSAAVSDLAQDWSFEYYVVIFIAVLSACLFSLLPPGTDDDNDNADERLMARVDFLYPFTCMLYLVTFLSQVTFRRRDDGCTRVSAIKALLCQMELGLLLWNRSRPRPVPNPVEFTERVHSNFVHLTESCFRVLQLPTFPDVTHTYRDMILRHRLRKRMQELRYEMTRYIIAIHVILEECKENGSIEAGETNRLTDYTRQLHVEMEQVHIMKQYRRPRVARDYFAMFLLICPPFWAPYFSAIAFEQASFVYALLLAIFCIIISLLLRQMTGVVEDTFLSNFKGENVRVADEGADVLRQLELIKKYCAARAPATARPRATTTPACGM